MAKYQRFLKGAIRIPLPDTTQQEDYSCGAACLQAVCKYFGVGPEDEWEYVEALRMDKKVGSHPFQIVRAARRYGLRFREKLGMSLADLKGLLRRRIPVLLMIQAWGERKYGGGYLRSYRGVWDQGHWVVAVGYDRSGVYFEDPSLQAVRGFLTFEELEERWHDVGPHNRHMDHYGLALWKPGKGKSAYESRAQRIP